MLRPPEMPPGVAMSLLGVDYFRLKTDDGGELFLTRFGLPFWKHLLPENWYAHEWFEANRERLEGTSTVYRVPTRPVDGRALDLVVKWSRVGEVVPLDTLTVNKFIHAEFNSPFEEFSLLMELRKGEAGPAGIRVRTQQPLAIYVPGQRLQLWQTGRSEDKIRAKVARHPDVEIDILRQYVVLYGWIKGRDAVETAEQFGLADRKHAEFLARTTSLVNHELWQKGYHVVDMKPAHIILRPRPDKSLLRDHNGQIAYALVDYELLERTREHEQAVRTANRQLYLKHMARRFEANAAGPLPAHLQATNLLGVDYIFGRAESTGGLLWVVGKDPDLFNYFLPERWRRTPKKNLSAHNEIFYTHTKDDIHLVWKISRMGEPPRPTNPEANQAAAKDYGFNSPLEEFAFALELARNGVKTVYPALQPRSQPGRRERLWLQQPVRGIFLRPRTRPQRHQDRLSPRHLHDRAQARNPTPECRQTPLRRPRPSAHARRRARRARGLRLHHHLGFLERPRRTAGCAGRAFLPGVQRQTRLC